MAGSFEKFSSITPLGFTKSIALEALIVSDFFQPPSLSIDWHEHENPTILFVLGGSAQESFRRTRFHCESSSVLVRPAEEVHSHLYGSNGARCLAIQVKSEYLQKSKDILQTLDRISFYRNSALISQARKIQWELQMMDEGTPLAIEGYFLEIVAKLIRIHSKKKYSSPPIWLKNARDLVNDCFKESMNLSEIAGEIGVHPSHLAETFRKHFGVTVGEYVRNLRLEFAFHEVSETGKTFAEIANEVGFYDQSHFAKRFKARFNATPGQVRQNEKNQSKS